MSPNETFDAVVVGAGPAGSIAARKLALAGQSVLLVDRARFPRPKVCGCCLSSACLAALGAEGLGKLPVRCGATPLRRFRVYAAGSSAELPTGGMALSRGAFDDALRCEAIGAGARFIGETTAMVLHALHSGSVPIRVSLGDRGEATGRILLVADGLSGSCLTGVPGFESTRAQGSHMGAGTIVAHPAGEYEPSTMFMAAGDEGYVGLVRIEDGSLNIAAALNPVACKHSGGPAHAARALIRRAGLPEIPSLDSASWRGTPLLTSRRARLELGPIMVVGDASGYVEPFTGQGMAWAVVAGSLAAGVALDKLRGTIPFDAPEWTRVHARKVGPLQRACRAVSWGLRRPVVVSATMRVLSAWPGAATPILRTLDWSATSPLPPASAQAH